MMYLTIMNIICFGTIGYLLQINGIKATHFSYWAIFVLVIVVQILPTVCFMGRNDDTQ